MNNKTFYHATYKPFLKSILRYGIDNKRANNLNWSDSKSGINCLATTADIAESYAEESENVPDEYLDMIVILKIDGSKLKKELLSLDENVVDNDGSTVQYSGVITTDAIINKNDLEKNLTKKPKFKR